MSAAFLAVGGTEKTREKLSLVDELLTYWSLEDADDTLEELEEALISADFGPKTALKVKHHVPRRFRRTFTSSTLAKLLQAP